MNLEISEIQLGGIGFSSSREEIKRKLGGAIEVIESQGNGKLEKYKSVGIGLEGEQIVSLHSSELALKGVLVPSPISLSTFCIDYGIPVSIAEKTSRSYPKVSFNIKAGRMTISLHHGQILGYSLTTVY